MKEHFMELLVFCALMAILALLGYSSHLQKQAFSECLAAMKDKPGVEIALDCRK
jgi:hypothetical protein